MEKTSESIVEVLEADIQACNSKLDSTLNEVRHVFMQSHTHIHAWISNYLYVYVRVHCNTCALEGLTRCNVVALVDH
jgi:hypothetical protein